jgi:hypothetical protein
MWHYADLWDMKMRSMTKWNRHQCRMSLLMRVSGSKLFRIISNSEEILNQRGRRGVVGVLVCMMRLRGQWWEGLGLGGGSWIRLGGGGG